MTTWPLVSLGELFDLEIGRTPSRAETRYWGPGYPWLAIADMKSRDLIETAESITEAAVNECRCRLVPAGTLVLSFKLSVGKVGVLQRPMYTNEAIAALRLRDPSRLDTGYGYHALRAVDFGGAGERAVKGITLNLDSLSKLRIPLPPIDEQRRIAAMLDKADAIRRKRQESLRLLDELLRSVFLEMFGDPVRNDRGWHVARLDRIARITTGNTPSRSHPEYYGDHIEWIKSDNINTPDALLSRSTEGLSPIGMQRARVAHPGAVLMTCIAGSKECIGNVAIADRAVAFNQQINAIELHGDGDHRFLYALLALGKPLVQRASTDSMKGMVSKGRLERILVIQPPMELQERFGVWFDHWHASRSRQCRAADLAVLFFDSLAQQPFSGTS